MYDTYMNIKPDVYYLNIFLNEIETINTLIINKQFIDS